MFQLISQKKIIINSNNNSNNNNNNNNLILFTLFRNVPKEYIKVSSFSFSF